MKKSNGLKDISNQIAEPTKEEIDQTIKMVKTKYDIVIQRDDATLFAKLTNEFGWWMRVEKASKQPESFDGEMAKIIKDIVKDKYGKDISENEASQRAQESFIITASKKKSRIADEMKAIIAKYK